MPMYHMYKRCIECLNSAIALLAGVLMLFLGLLMVWEIFLRFSGTPSSWISEVSTYLFSGAMMAGMAFTLQQDKHIRVELLTMCLPATVRNLLNGFTAIIGCIFCIVISHNFWLHLMDVYEIGETTPTPLRIPLYIKDFPMFLGFVLLSLQFSILAIDRFIGTFLLKRFAYEEK